MKREDAMHPATYATVKAVAGRYDCHVATIWRLLKTDPTFPKPVKISEGCTRWRIADLEAWEAHRQAA